MSALQIIMALTVAGLLLACLVYRRKKNRYGASPVSTKSPPHGSTCTSPNPCASCASGASCSNAAGCASCAVPALAEPVKAPAKAKPISVVVTSDKLRLAQGSSIKWRKSSAADVGRDIISMQPGTRFQSILGFGGAFTDSACYMFNELAPSARARLFYQLFHPSELGLNLNRVPMGASDYATHVYSYCDSDTPDPELKKFNLDHDRKYILPMLQKAMAVNPEMFLFGSPWSPPGWMKSNNSMLGGNMRRSYMGSHAQYFVRFVQGYGEAGVPIKAVTVNNEVDTDQDGRMPACLWPQEYEVDFVRYDLGPAFEKAGLTTQVWMIDHNYNLWGRALASLEEPGVTKYATAIAWHGYVGDPARVTQVRSAFPNIDMFWTEGGPDYTDPNYAQDWAKWAKSFTGILRNWNRGITVWNLALDEQGRPNIGPFPCGGLVTINSQTKDVSYSGQFWALAHFSRYVKRGAVRVESTATLDDVQHVAFQNPDGQMVVVLTNGGDTRRSISLSSAGMTADVDLEPNSVTTMTW